MRNLISNFHIRLRVMVIGIYVISSSIAVAEIDWGPVLPAFKPPVVKDKRGTVSPIVIPPKVVEPIPEAELAEPIPAAEPTPELYKYCITLNIEFDINSAMIRPEYLNAVAKVGEFMVNYSTTTAVIEGHTDNVEDNISLSQHRAESVVNYLVSKFGIDRSRLSAKGYGSSRPIADSSTDAGKQKNCRIEAIIDCAFAFDIKNIVTPPEQLCLSIQLHFDSGSTDIKPSHRTELSKAGDFMKKYPTTRAIIEGHTDKVGGNDYNMKLSQKRAERIVNYLVTNFGIAPSRLSAKGYGYSRRIAYESTPEGRTKNRRINIIIDCITK